jgi:hypothetical protein
LRAIARCFSGSIEAKPRLFFLTVSVISLPHAGVNRRGVTHRVDAPFSSTLLKLIIEPLFGRLD